MTIPYLLGGVEPHLALLPDSKGNLYNIRSLLKYFTTHSKHDIILEMALLERSEKRGVERILTKIVGREGLEADKVPTSLFIALKLLLKSCGVSTGDISSLSQLRRTMEANVDKVLRPAFKPGLEGVFARITWGTLLGGKRWREQEAYYFDHPIFRVWERKCFFGITSFVVTAPPWGAFVLEIRDGFTLDQLVRKRAAVEVLACWGGVAIAERWDLDEGLLLRDPWFAGYLYLEANRLNDHRWKIIFSPIAPKQALERVVCNSPVARVRANLGGDLLNPPKAAKVDVWNPDCLAWEATRVRFEEIGHLLGEVRTECMPLKYWLFLWGLREA